MRRFTFREVALTAIMWWVIGFALGVVAMAGNNVAARASHRAEYLQDVAECRSYGGVPIINRHMEVTGCQSLEERHGGR